MQEALSPTNSSDLYESGIPKPASGTTYVQHSDKERNLWYLSADLLVGYWVQVVRAGASIFEELRWPPWTPESYRMRVRGGFSATSCKKIPWRVVASNGGGNAVDGQQDNANDQAWIAGYPMVAEKDQALKWRRRTSKNLAAVCTSNPETN